MRTWSQRLATVLTTVCLIAALVPPAPAAASHGVDLANVAPTGWTASIGGDGASGGTDSCPASLACDASETTGRRVDSNCPGGFDAGHGSHPYCAMALAFTRASGVTTFDVASFRVKFQSCQTGTGSTCGGASLNMLSLTIQELVGGTCSGAATELYHGTQSASPTYESVEVDLDTPHTVSNNGGFCFFVEQSAANTVEWFTATSVEVYEDPVGPEVVPITDYLYGLRVSHPPFERVIYWEWRDVDCGGSWSIVDGDDDVFGGDFLNCAGEFVGQYERFSISCPLVCGEDTYTITINDTGRDRVATYEIDGDADGLLIPETRAPIITLLRGCYNDTTDQCVGIDATLWTAQAAGKAQVNYTWNGDDSDVSLCHQSKVTADAVCDGTALEVDGQAEGNWRITFPISGSVDETKSATFILRLTNATGEYDWGRFTVDFGTGGQVDSPQDDSPGGSGSGGDGGVDIRECNGFGAVDPQLLVCRLGQLLDVLVGTFNSAVVNLWGPSIAAMREAASEKLPFAYVVLALDGVNAQISRAALEVEASDDCAGVVLTVPLYYGSSNLSASPSPFPITVLNCAGLEPTMGTDWYQAVRTMMDPALWILFGWSQVKALQPKTSLNG